MVMFKRVALCALALVATTFSASAWCGDGFVTSRAEAAKVLSQMTADEVRTILGTPQRTFNYRNMPGATWVYGLTDLDPAVDNDRAILNVDFDATGRVAAVTDRTIHSRGGKDKVIKLP
jgi:outer membrane protein assembly factor BamE (lipoprotein component of BamABCDE complex)